VLPVALALEWFTALSGETSALRDLRVLRKVALGGFTGVGDLVRVTGPARGGTLELHCQGERPHYTAIRVSRTEPAQWAWAGDRKPLDGPVYDGDVLFHGERFRVLREVLGVSPTGAQATLVGLRDMGWPDGGWHTDPAAVDGALQLATLWAREVLGGATLPMGVGEFRWYRPGPVGGPVTAVVRPSAVGSDQAECDVRLSMPDGSPVADLERVRLIARPASATTK
jgi:hypothetical protein